MNLFTFSEPLANHRVVLTRNHRTKLDWAECGVAPIEWTVRGFHGLSSLYEAFQPAEAQRLAARLETHYMPEHGSWLNMAGIEQSVMARQVLGRRIPNRLAMKQRTTAWQKQRNASDATVNGQFATEEARVKLSVELR